MGAVRGLESKGERRRAEEGVLFDEGSPRERGSDGSLAISVGDQRMSGSEDMHW